jgi:hypothetical protein
MAHGWRVLSTGWDPQAPQPTIAATYSKPDLSPPPPVATMSPTEPPPAVMAVYAVFIADDSHADPTTDPGYVTRAECEEDWLFTVASGTLGCDRDAATFTHPTGQVWVLNGLAISRGIRELDDTIWFDNEEMLAELREAFPDEDRGTIKLSIHDMTSGTLSLCD